MARIWIILALIMIIAAVRMTPEQFDMPDTTDGGIAISIDDAQNAYSISTEHPRAQIANDESQNHDFVVSAVEELPQVSDSPDVYFVDYSLRC